MHATNRAAWTTALTLLVIGGVSLWGNRPSADRDSPNPASRPLEYRPGAYFPEGFPLHGEIRLLTAPVAEMGRRHRVKVEYTVGDLTLDPGMSLEIWKHFTSDVEAFQTDDSEAPAYFDAKFTSPGVNTEQRGYTNEARRDTPSVFPYRRAAQLTITEGRVGSGEKVVLDLGGPKGVRMQHYEENLFNFRLVIVRDTKVLGYAGDVFLKVTGGPLKKLRVQAPSVVKVGEEIPLEILPQDEWGSLAKNHESLELLIEGDRQGVDITYDGDLMHYVASGLVAGAPGVLRFRVQTANGEARGESNPVWVERHPKRRIYFGDLHQHTYLHDGRGTFEELYLYARRVGMLDFGALTPHHQMLTGIGPRYHLEGVEYPSDNWPALIEANRAIKGWRGFVPILGYEYSVGTAAGGHHNVFYNADEAPTTMHLDPNRPLAPIGEMLETLQRARKPTLVIPHVGGGPPDWNHPTDPRIERLYEIASVHGVFEESYQKHLEAGLRLAASASGDTHTTSFGNAYPGIIYTMTNPLTGVYAYSKTRDDIWAGLYEKRSFGVTGNQRVLVDLKVNGEPMGGEVPRAKAGRARINARASGLKPLLRVDVLKNSKVIYSTYPARKRGGVLRVSWGDNIYQRRTAESLATGSLTAAEGRLALVRVLQQDQAFESVRQQGGAITWRTSTTSNDRDPILVDLTEVDGDVLHFELDDSRGLGHIKVDIPLDELRNKGSFAWQGGGTKPYEHTYMKKMGVPVKFALECDLVDPDGPMDVEFSYADRVEPQPGDYYYLRVMQLDGHIAWTSPVWFN